MIYALAMLLVGCVLVRSASAEFIIRTETTAVAYPTTSESANLIGMGSFRADPDYVGVDGDGYAVVILDTGIDLDHPFFGPMAMVHGTVARTVGVINVAVAL